MKTLITAVFVALLSSSAGAWDFWRRDFSDDRSMYRDEYGFWHHVNPEKSGWPWRYRYRRWDDSYRRDYDRGRSYRDYRYDDSYIRHEDGDRE